MLSVRFNLRVVVVFFMSDTKTETEQSSILKEYGFSFLRILQNAYDFTMKDKEIESADEVIFAFLRSLVVNVLYFICRYLQDKFTCFLATQIFKMSN
jgi:hypothetical protein